MNEIKITHEAKNLPGRFQAGWVYKMGAAAAILAVLAAVAEIAITFISTDAALPTNTVIDWFTLFQKNWFIGMRNLGLINIFINVMAIPAFFSLFVVHRENYPFAAGLAALVAWIGVGVFFATNRALPMLALSREYFAATSEVQRATIAAAGQAMLSVGQSHTPGTFLGFALSEIAGLMISAVMLRAGVFSKTAAYAGLLAFGCLFIFEIVASFDFLPFTAATMIALVGGLASLVWYTLIARRLWALSAQA